MCSAARVAVVIVVDEEAHRDVTINDENLSEAWVSPILVAVVAVAQKQKVFIEKGGDDPR